MPIGDELIGASLMTSIGITLIAAFLGLRQWYERQAREQDLSSDDRAYFQRQDIRRGIGVAVMLAIAIALAVSARIPHKVGGQANWAFIEIWLVVSSLIVVLLFLALIDWIETRSYARRIRRALARERIEMLRDTLSQAAGTPPDPENEPDAELN
jgi:cobalamin biosynthesis protein CobD/CbiB